MSNLRNQTNVEEVLKNWPGAYVVFMNRRTNCIGCFLQKFCTLEDVAETYRIPIQDLVDDLEKIISKHIQVKGVTHE